MFAIVSDVHSNLKALQEAIKAIDAELGTSGIVYNLGDVVGYGPRPVECLDLIRARAAWSLLGNHDQGVTWDPKHFNEHAERALLWTRERFTKANGSDDYFEYLDQLKPSRKVDGLQFVHASPRDPVNEYIKPEDVHDERKMRAIEQLVPSICFCGHTHLPGVFRLGSQPTFVSAAEEGVQVLAEGVPCVVNVGSVGQPRDRDPRACYVIFDPQTRTVHYRRVEYAFEETAKEILLIKELSPFYAERLRLGK